MTLEEDYLNIAKADNLKNRKDRIIYRFLEILPGFISWSTILGALILSWWQPSIVAIFIIVFDLYWLMRIAYLSYHQVISYRKMKKNMKENWLEKLELLDKDWKNIYHLIILPFYKEGKEIVQSSCQAIVDCDYPKKRMVVVLATEQKAGPAIKKQAKEIADKFSDKFFSFLITVHPQNILGEVRGKGSNVAWAMEKAKELIKEKKIKKENVIVSTFDIDTRPYPKYFSCVTFYFLTAKNPLRSSFQPIPVYNNNVWSAPSFSRLVATSNTFWQMMQQERPDLLVTYSSHSMPLKVLEEVKYPKTVVPDDSRIFWKAYLFYNGNYRVVPIHYPVSLDAVLAKNLSRTIVNQYKQQRRWAWGCVDIPFLMFNFLKDKKIALRKKIYHSWNMLDGFWSWAVASLLIFSLGWLPLLLGGEKFNVTMLSYNLPRTTRNIMTVSMLGMIVSSITSLLILPERPKTVKKIKNLSFVLQWFLLPITLIVFGSIPALDAQTNLIFKNYLEFWVTEKTRL